MLMKHATANGNNAFWWDTTASVEEVCSTVKSLEDSKSWNGNLLQHCILGFVGFRPVPTVRKSAEKSAENRQNSLKIFSQMSQ
jgi:hypothetical protein